MRQDLTFNKDHFDECHKRWMEKRYRRQESANYKDEWYGEQCGSCKYYVYLSGVFSDDYGICSNPTSRFDGIIRFEHDGCEHFED
jgi:Protein of unknown function (DUF3027)